MNKERKFIRFPRKTLKNLMVSFLAFLFTIFILIQAYSFQTYLGRRASEYFSKELKTEVRIGRVGIDFFQFLELKEVYLSDQHGDTLLSADKISCHISKFIFPFNQLYLGKTQLNGVNGKIIRYQGEEDFNFQFLVDYFSPSKTDSTSRSEFEIFYGDLELKEVSFSYQDKNDTSQQKMGVDFNDIRLDRVNGIIKSFSINEDTIKAEILNLTFKEKSGFEIAELGSKVEVSPRGIKLNDLVLKTPNSNLSGNYSMLTQSYDDYSDFLNLVGLNANFNKNSVFNPSDLAFFVPELKGLDQDIIFNGSVNGSVSALRIKDLFIAYRKNTVFSGDLKIDGLPNLNEAYFNIQIDTLRTNRSDLINIPIPPFSEKKKLDIPDIMSKFGIIKFKGNIDGMVNDIVSYGVLDTDLGKVKMDIGLRKLDDRSNYTYKGGLSTNQFQIGVLTGNTDLGAVTMNVSMNGSGFTLDDLEANLDGLISSVEYKKYPYQNISLHGKFKKKLFTGNFESADPNATLVFNGTANFQNKIPELDFNSTISHIDFSKLNFFKLDSSSSFSSKLFIKLNGDQIDNLTGRVNFENTHFALKGKKYDLENFDLILEQNKFPKSIELNSEVADLNLSGNYNLMNLPLSLGRFLNYYYPTFFDLPAASISKNKLEDQVSFKVKLKKFGEINGLVLPDLNINNGLTLEGYFDSKNNFISCLGQIEKMKFNDLVISDWKIKMESSKGIDLTSEFGKVSLLDSFYLQNLKASISSLDNKSTFAIDWLNNTPQRNSGHLKGNINFSNINADLSLEELKIYIQDSLWSLEKQNRIAIDSTGRLEFKDVYFRNNAQLLGLNGVFSPATNEKLFIETKDFKLKQLNPLLRDVDITLDGFVSGTSTILFEDKNFLFISELDFKNLFFNNQLIGSGKVNASYDKAKEAISMNGGLKKVYSVAMENSFHNLYFKGYYYPKKKDDNIDLELKINSIELAILQPYVKDILTFGPGYLSGELTVKGNVEKPLIEGDIDLQSIKKLKVDYLNTFYRVSGSIKISSDQIAFERIYITDQPGNSGILWGNIFHDNFKNLKYDFDVNFNKLNCLNTNASNNTSFYGKAFASGRVGIWGNSDGMNIDVDLKTEKGTQFNIPLSGPAEVGENDFIHFIVKDTITNGEDEKNDLSRMNLNFNLEATPDAEVQLIFDAKAGDIIRAKGNGNIKMLIDNRGKFEMLGPYTITDGSYLFTLENFINKKFDIENGSTIKWSGDPYNAQINISANYKQRASLAPFFPSQQQSSSTSSETTTGVNASSNGTSGTGNNVSSAFAGQDINKRYPVECKLYMKDKLLSPDITFGIALPTIDDALRQTVLGYINNEQELNRQVFSLLILKSFVTPLALSNQSGVNAGSAVGSNATEMLSNQLSNWLSQLTTNMDVGVNYRPGNTLSNEELDLALSTQLFNDKLSIDGNVGLNNNAQTKSSNMIGDLNMDYKITEDGKLRVKGFNRSNDTYLATTQGGQFTQGVGFFYREDFENIAELYKRYTKFISKKKSTPKKSN